MNKTDKASSVCHYFEDHGSYNQRDERPLNRKLYSLINSPTPKPLSKTISIKIKKLLQDYKDEKITNQDFRTNGGYENIKNFNTKGYRKMGDRMKFDILDKKTNQMQDGVVLVFRQIKLNLDCYESF